MIQMSLIGSSSSLGLNWIYDRKLMKEFSKNNEVLFLPIQHELYKIAENGFDVYPNHEIGDLDFMGEVIYHYHRYLSSKHPVSLKEFMYLNIGPESPYTGYIEKYGKVLIENIHDGNNHTTLIDKQLIGPAMYVIGYSHDLDDNTILEHSKVFTAYQNTTDFHVALKFIFTNINKENKTEVLKQSIKFLSEEYKDSMYNSLSDIELYEFIDKYSGVACGLDQSYPLIYYIINNSDTFKEALTLNASLGGASSARGIIIGAIYSIFEDVPTEYKHILNLDV